MNAPNLSLQKVQTPQPVTLSVMRSAVPNIVYIHLANTLTTERDRQFRKGRMLSTVDVGYILDRALEEYEDTHGDTMSEDEFDKFLGEICADLLRKKLIYIAGDRTSYLENVRGCALISRQEAIMRKAIVGSGTVGSGTVGSGTANVGAKRHRIIFRDTEFPYDETTGMYIL